MPEKLDPVLTELVERADAGLGDSGATVDVLVAIDIPIDEDVRNDLAARGLGLRSEIGTILTGSIRLDDVGRLADSTHVVKIEAGAPLYLEAPGAGGSTSWSEGGEG